MIFLLLIVSIRAEPIERISAPSLRDFMGYAMQSKPVIITNYSAPFENMTREHILNTCGHLTVAISQFNKNIDTWANLETVRTVNMKNFMNSKENTSEVGIFDYPLPRMCPEMLENWTVPKYFVQDFFQRVKKKGFHYKTSWPSLFFGLPGSFGGLHRDSGGTAFWQYVIEGKKDWRVLNTMQRITFNFFGDKSTQFETLYNCNTPFLFLTEASRDLSSLILILLFISFDLAWKSSLSPRQTILEFIDSHWVDVTNLIMRSGPIPAGSPGENKMILNLAL